MAFVPKEYMDAGAAKPESPVYFMLMASRLNGVLQRGSPNGTGNGE